MFNGQVVIGALVGFDLSEPQSASERQFGNIKVMCNKASGEPYWFQAWFPVEPRNPVLRQLRELSEGELVIVTIAPKAKPSSRAGGDPRISYLAESVTELRSVFVPVSELDSVGR